MMIQLSTILAETRMAEVSMQYREVAASGGTSGWWYLLIPFAAIAIAALIYYVGTRPPKAVNTPGGMLHELCAAHGIGAGARSLMELIAEEAELDQPAIMLTSRERFDSAVQVAGKHIQYDRRKEATLQSLRQTLFSA